MIGVDCNILVQLAFADHPANAKTIAAVQTETTQGKKLVLPSLVVNEFLHAATDARRFAPPLTMAEALDWIEDFLKNPKVSLLEPSKASTDQALLWMRQFNLGRKRILDTHVAAARAASAACSFQFGRFCSVWRFANSHAITLFPPRPAARSRQRGDRWGRHNSSSKLPSCWRGRHAPSTSLSAA